MEPFSRWDRLIDETISQKLEFKGEGDEVFTAVKSAII